MPIQRLPRSRRLSRQRANLPYALVERPVRQLFTLQSRIALGLVG